MVSVDIFTRLNVGSPVCLNLLNKPK